MILWLIPANKKLLSVQIEDIPMAERSETKVLGTERDMLDLRKDSKLYHWIKERTRNKGAVMSQRSSLVNVKPQPDF